MCQGLNGHMPKFNNEICENGMTFEDCELAILRHAVDVSEETAKKRTVNTEPIRRMIRVLEDFLVKKKLVCYGGTAINNILPKEAQFYDNDVEIPDYDFYSPTPMEDAIELSNIYHKEGYTDVEAKAGVHYGTFKVYVNFIPIADITLLPEAIFTNIRKEAISIAGILYAPPNFLRMNMYLELSRPLGDVSRWEKVLKRLTILNKYYPLNVPYNCSAVDFQRKMDDISLDNGDSTKKGVSLQETIYFTIRNSFMDQGVIFFGGYASSLYGKFMPAKQRKMVKNVPDFDVIAEEPERVTTIIQERLKDIGVNNVSVLEHKSIGEIIPKHYEIRVGKDILAHVYEPVACHSYNEITVSGRTVRVGSIDTLLTFYLAFVYVNLPYYYKDRIMCMCKFLFDVQQQNRLNQTGILKRFSVKCIGKQPTLVDIRAEKTEKFKELGANRKSREYQMWFLKYNPADPKGTVQGTDKGTDKAKPVKNQTAKVSNTNIVNKTKSKKHTKKNKTYKSKAIQLLERLGQV